MLLFEANIVFLRRSCRKLYVMNGRRRRTKIKWRIFGTDLSLQVNGTVLRSSRYMCISVMFVMDYMRAGEYRQRFVTVL